MHLLDRLEIDVNKQYRPFDEEPDTAAAK